MIKRCLYCQQTFKALRKDKCFCSQSCRQMAFVKRKEGVVFLASKCQNVNLNEHKIDVSLDALPSEIDVLKEAALQNASVVDASLDVSTFEPDVLKEKRIQNTSGVDTSLFENDASRGKKTKNTPLIDDLRAESNISRNADSTELKSKTKTVVYKKVPSPLFYSIDWDLAFRGYEEGFIQIISTYGIKAPEVKWVSENYYCIIRCLLLLHEQRIVFWEDLAEITNALIFLCTTEEFRALPENYPYILEIPKLRDKLNAFCVSSQCEEKISLLLRYETRYFLLLHQKELSVFPKITFNQLIQRYENKSKKSSGD